MTGLTKATAAAAERAARARGGTGRVSPVGAAPNGTANPHPPCDEVLAARLADGLRRLIWLGEGVERLARRVRRGAPARVAGA